MKKYISVIGILTILSGCGTALDFWSEDKPNPLTTGKRPPMLNRGAPVPAAPLPYGSPPLPPISADYDMPSIIDEAGYMPMPVPPPSLESAPSPSYVGGVLPSGRRAPKFNSQQFAAAPVPIVSQQAVPLEPLGDVNAYQPVVVSSEYQQEGTAMIPPPPPPPTALELSSATSADALTPINDADLTSLEQELGLVTVQPVEPPKVIVPVRAPEAPQESTDFESLKPLPATASNDNNFDDKGYPVLANIPSAPPAPIPVEQDSRAAELRNSYSNQNPQGAPIVVTKNSYNYGDIPPPPPPMPVPNYQETPQKITVPVTSKNVDFVEIPQPLEQPAPALNSFESQPSNTLMPEGPTVVIRSKKSAPQPFHSSEADIIQPIPEPFEPSAQYSQSNIAPLTLNPAPVVTVTATGSSNNDYSTASTNIDDLSPITNTSPTTLVGYKPVLAQSRYSALRAQARSSVRY